MGLQAALLTSTALTAEVDTFKQSLERSENELGRPRSSSRTMKVSNTLLKLYLTEKDFGWKKNDKDNMGIAGATNEVATLKEGVRGRT